MRALLCHCRGHLEARDDRALAEEVRKHLMREHPALASSLASSDEQVREIARTRAYDLQYASVIPDEELVYDPY
jgi:diadenosine tetraphosphatase ApaH/serine/threonine PP2A family protein phosphatase